MKVEAMTGRGGMDQANRDLSCAPCCNVLGGIDVPAIKPLMEPVVLMMKPVGNEQRFPVGGFDQILQGVQLSGM